MRFQERRFREMRFSGLKLGIIEFAVSVAEQRGFKIIFYNASNTKVGELGSDIQESKIASISFELLDFGCGSFSMTMDSIPDFEIGYRTMVAIYPYFDTQPWFFGFIQQIPKPGQTSRPFEYSGFGFFDQLDWVLVSGDYYTMEIADIVKDIIENIVSPNTQIIYNPVKIENTGYTLESISFEYRKAKDAIQALASIAQNFEFGVDNLREFYFRQIDTDEKSWKWTGFHFGGIDITEDPTGIVNRIIIKAGQIQSGGSNIAITVDHPGSISDYGLKEEVMTAPDILDIADAERWGEWQLEQKRSPIIQAAIKQIDVDLLKTLILPQGKMKVTSETGLEYTLPIKKITYSISPSGILADIELGEIRKPFEKHIVDLLRRIEEESHLQDKRTAQLY